jgi:hypothetical protein
MFTVLGHQTGLCCFHPTLLSSLNIYIISSYALFYVLRKYGTGLAVGVGASKLIFTP